jgi:Protein of unknown function (DUF2939)
MQSKLKIAIAALLSLAFSVGAHWYYSPYIAMNSMVSAAKAKDADTFNEYVDYPSLRESFKGQFSAKLADVMGSQPSNRFSALGAMLGMTIINQMVDALVRPELVMKMMEEGKAQQPNKSAGGKQTTEESNTKAPKWEFERKGTDLVLATPIQEGSNDSQPVFVFRRVGYANWRLTEVRLPAVN